MPIRNSDTGKSSLLSLRIDPRQQAVIDLAAEATGKTRSAFLLEAAYKEAEEVLLDQKVFHLNDQQWQAFHSLLDMPPASHTMLKSFLQKKAPWEN